MIGIVIYLIIGAIIGATFVVIDDRVWNDEVFHTKDGTSKLVGVVALWPAVVIMVIGLVISSAIETWQEIKNEK